MKRFLLFLSFLLLYTAGWSQVKKVYAYAQGFIPGVRQETVVIEGGEQQKVEQPEERVSYLLYAEQSGASKVIFSTAWIKGKAYPVKADIVNTPIEMKTNEETGDGKIVLAPASKQKVWALTAGSLYKKQPGMTSALQKLVNKHELVLVYTWKNKLYYYPVKKIKILSPAVAI